MTLNILIKNSGFQLVLGTLRVFVDLNAKKNKRIDAGKPVITLKLRGGISSTAILKRDHTELQTKIRRINKTIVIKLFDRILFFFITKIS